MLKAHLLAGNNGFICAYKVVESSTCLSELFGCDLN